MSPTTDISGLPRAIAAAFLADEPVAHADQGSRLATVFTPPEPTSLEKSGLTAAELEELVLKLLLARGASTGRDVADEVAMPLRIVAETLDRARAELLLALKGSAGLHDFIYELTEAGFERAQRFFKRCSYVGAAPVPLDAYLASVHKQSIREVKLELATLCQALADLQVRPSMVSQLGQALNAGRGLFLYGPPGNGKTSLAERLTAAYPTRIWIPRTVGLNGELVRLYDPSCHREDPQIASGTQRFDRRWVLIERPTIIVGGELTLEALDVRVNRGTGISEAPVHIKANGGTFVVDDFGRQRVTCTEILNRLIVPLEKHRDYVNLPSGRQVQLPVDQLMIFSTNLAPADLVDEAFLRRIPYKMEVPDPTESEFRVLFHRVATEMGFAPNPLAFEYLLRKYYCPQKRPFRNCHPRDLLRQIANLCEFHDLPVEITAEHLDVAVRNYFSAM